SPRWGLVRLRQNSPTWRLSPDCHRPVTNLDAIQDDYGDSNPCDAGGIGNYGIYTPTVSGPNYSQPAGGAVMVAPGSDTFNDVFNVLTRPIGDNAGLVPAGSEGAGFQDRPITLALQDARQAVINAMMGDAASFRSCRNTIVVLVTSGKDDGSLAYTASNDPVATASTFLNVSDGTITRRVPIHVVGVLPPGADESELQAIAAASGGVYTRATAAEDVAAAINKAVQAGYSREADFTLGKPSEYTPVSPIVGTVNLKDARAADGTLLPNTEITASFGGPALPQRSNVLITAGFALPGFEGRLRAFRTFRPEPD